MCKYERVASVTAAWIFALLCTSLTVSRIFSGTQHVSAGGGLWSWREREGHTAQHVYPRAFCFVSNRTDIFAGEPPPLPVALALAEVVANQRGGLTRRWFDRVLDARMADLERAQPETIEEMET